MYIDLHVGVCQNRCIHVDIDCRYIYVCIDCVYIQKCVCNAYIGLFEDGNWRLDVYIGSLMECIYVYTCVYMCIHVYICVYLCIYVYILEV